MDQTLVESAWSLSRARAMRWQSNLPAYLMLLALLTSGCVLSGSVTVTNAKNDIYGITYRLECSGDYAVLNGVPFSGLAEMDSNTSSPHMLIGASGQLSGSSYAMVLSLTAS
jgi:hypothetical protein